MDVDIEVDNGSLTVHMASARVVLRGALEVDTGPGWFDSSRALLQGLDVVESPEDLNFPNCPDDPAGEAGEAGEAEAAARLPGRRLWVGRGEG